MCSLPFAPLSLFKALARAPTRTVLVVDDDQAVRRFMATVLRGEGYSTLEAGDGREAVRVFGACHPDVALVVTDLEMPVMDGFQAMGLMRKIDPAVPILIVTGCATDPASHPECRWLQKPFTPRQFLDCVLLALG